MEVIKDLFSIPKSKGEFFWKGFIIGCIIGIGIGLLMLLSWNNFGQNNDFHKYIIPLKLFKEIRE